MTAMRAKDRCGSFLRPGRTAERSGNRRNRSVSAYSGHFDVKELGIKDCVLIDPACGAAGLGIGTERTAGPQWTRRYTSDVWAG